MGNNESKKEKLVNNSAFAIAAGCAVVFMFIVTIISVIMYQRRMADVSNMVTDGAYNSLDKYVVFIAGDEDSDYWNAVFEAAREKGNECGIYVDRISDSLNGTYSKEELLEMAIYSGCDGILVEGSQSDEMTKLLGKAYDEGIPVISMNSDCDHESRVSYVGVNSYSISKLYARQLVGLLGDETQVLVLKNQNIEEERSSIIVNGIQEAVNDELTYNENNTEKTVEYAVSEVDSSEAFSTEEFVQNLFLSDQLPDVIICLDELTTTCVYQALIDYNMVGQIQLLGYFKSDTILQGINQGVINSTVTVDAAEVGHSCVEGFLEYFDTGYVSDYISIEVSLIDKENVGEFLEVGND